MGGYAFIEDDSAHAAINLRSPCFDLTGLVNPNLRFFMYSHNSGGTVNQNLLSVDVISYPSGAITTNVFGPQPQGGPQWTLQAADLSPFIGQVIQVVFRGETSGSGSNTHDIAIDDFRIVDLMPTPGQVPQPGAAVLNINEPTNANGDPLQFGFGGPYFTSVTAGDTLLFKMEGTPLATIILLAGPLNPASATFAGVGQLDIGGVVDPMTGIPTLITVLADGSQQGGFNPFFTVSNVGTMEVGFSIPNFPTGVLGTFQSVFVTSASPGVFISNTVQVSVQ
jgi:hypothetical protein